jgi:colanic acid biosynthesis glycosyl transferase WcaI
MIKKIVLHDYGGHPFSYDLARELVKKGHKVIYMYNSGCSSPNAVRQKKSDSFQIIDMNSGKIKKDNFFYRKLQEHYYGYQVIKKLKKIKPDIIISSTTPLDAQYQITLWANRCVN